MITLTITDVNDLTALERQILLLALGLGEQRMDEKPEIAPKAQVVQEPGKPAGGAGAEHKKRGWPKGKPRKTRLTDPGQTKAFGEPPQIQTNFKFSVLLKSKSGRVTRSFVLEGRNEDEVKERVEQAYGQSFTVLSVSHVPGAPA